MGWPEVTCSPQHSVRTLVWEIIQCETYFSAKRHQCCALLKWSSFPSYPTGSLSKKGLSSQKLGLEHFLLFPVLAVPTNLSQQMHSKHLRFWPTERRKETNNVKKRYYRTNASVAGWGDPHTPRSFSPVRPSVSSPFPWKQPASFPKMSS